MNKSEISIEAMENPVMEINGTEYELSTTLRVAYKIQAMNNHKPYSEVFKGLADMPVEDQINIVYAAFSCANPEVSKTFNQQAFQNYCLDNMNIHDLMMLLNTIIRGIMGDPDESTDTDTAEEVDVKN